MSQPAFMRRPIRLRCYVAVCVAAAVVLPWSLSGLGPGRATHGTWLTLGTLVVLSVMNVEYGRLLEGGLARSHRPHKALSAWAFAAAMLLPTWWLAPLVAVTYAHARWRGLRVPLWKWVGSGSFVTLAALAASCTAQAAEPPGATWTAGGVGGVLVVTAAAAVFLAVETALFHGTAYLNEPADEVWLRGTLRSRDFYLTEGATLLVGGLSAAMWAQQSWLVLLLVPVYGLAQRAVLHQPLVERANVDAKTGVLRFEAWRRLAVAERDRCAARRQPWSVIFADLDHFKRYNDTWGHLAGDEALAAVAALCKQQLRAGRDLAGRFGGEEFCLFLPGTGSAEAAAVAERLRVAVREMRLPSSGACVTLSLGVAGSDGTTGDVEFAEVMHQADRTLLEAKTAGRDGVRVAVVDAADERLLRSWPGVTPHP